MKKKYETEWAFSFANLNESIRSGLRSVGIGEDLEIKTASFVEPLDGASEARITLEPTIGLASISALSDSDRLFEADITHVGTLKFETKREGSRANLHLWQPWQNDVMQPIRDALGAFGRRDELTWDMRLSPDLPLDLQINSGATSNDFELHALQLVALSLNSGAGSTRLKLPTMGARYPVTVNSGAGSLSLDVPDGAAMDLHVNVGAGQTEIQIGANVTLSAHIKGGVGKCVLHVPADAALRLKAATGIGDVNVPDHLLPVKVDQFIATSGTWETADYEAAEFQIDLHFEGGVGGLSIISD
jgi:hypothetical protein